MVAPHSNFSLGPAMPSPASLRLCAPTFLCPSLATMVDGGMVGTKKTYPPTPRMDDNCARRAIFFGLFSSSLLACAFFTLRE